MISKAQQNHIIAGPKQPTQKPNKESTLFGGRGVLGDSLCAFGDSVLGKFAR